jgi:membrane protease YdiL (CAAX protease family)
LNRRSYIYWYPLLLVFAWIGAWLLNLGVRSAFHWDVTADTVYWIAMKLLIWLMPVCALILVVEGKKLVDFLELRRFWRGTAWGLLAGLVVVTADFLLVAHPSRRHLTVPEPGAAFLNGVVMAPITEEITFRGFFLERLQLNGISFWRCNLVTSAVFIAMHMVGWTFQGRIGSPVHLVQTVAPLLLLSLFFGWLKQKTGSLYAPLAIHVLNNVYQFALRSA